MNLKRIVVFLLAIVAIIAFIIALRWIPTVQNTTEQYATHEEKGFDTTLDAGVESGKAETASEQEIMDSLNKKVEDGMINASMNPYPEFATGASEGNLMIVNEDFNNYPQVVEIISKGEVIYRSGLIPVGSRVETGKLLSDLDKGEYDCVAEFHNVDEKTGKSLGKAGVAIVVKVLG